MRIIYLNINLTNILNDIMKVQFLMPPALNKKEVPERLFGCAYSLYPQVNIFILYAAAVLEKAGYDVEYADYPIEGENDVNLDSDVYIFYTTFLAEKIDKYWANKIRKKQPNAIIIFSGPEPTSRPKDFILDKKTFVVRGEIELTFLDLIKALENKKQSFKKILGISWKEGNKIIHNKPRSQMTTEELDRLPFPARHLIKNPERYYNPKLSRKPSTVMITSRQCFGNCIYCIPNSYSFAREIEHKKWFKKKFSNLGLRSADSIIEEFKEIKNLGYKSVSIIDDNFINNPERMKKILKGIKGIDIEWGCLSRADVLREDIVKLMKESGCVYTDIGIESLDQKVLDYVHKGLKVEDNIRAIKLLQKYHIIPKVNILIGASPLETEESIKKTVETLIKLDIEYVTFAIVLPHPETAVYKIAKDKNWFVTKNKDYTPVSPIDQSIISFPDGLSSKDYERLLKWCYRRFYLRPRLIMKKIRGLKNYKTMRDSIVTAYNLLVGRI